MSKPTRFAFDKASLPPPVPARLKPMVSKDGVLIGYKVLCGRAHPCPHRLGYLLAPALGPSGAWVIDHADHYGGDAEHGYRILRNRHQTSRGVAVGRRPLDTAKLEPWVREKYGSLSERSIVGQRPVLPCRIVCACGTPNDVVAPTA